MRGQPTETQQQAEADPASGSGTLSRPLSPRDALLAENCRLRQALRSLETTVLSLKRDTEHLRALIFRDELTGLPNRRCFEAHMDTLLTQDRNPGRFSVLFIDLDDFKQINDSAGHYVGDALLRHLAGLLHMLVRRATSGCDSPTPPIVARLSGDEFVAVLPEVAEDRSAISTARLILEHLRTPIEIDGVGYPVSVSIGVAIHPRDGSTAGTLIRNADAAMYRAKQRGKAGYALPECSTLQAVS